MGLSISPPDICLFYRSDPDTSPGSANLAPSKMRQPPANCWPPLMGAIGPARTGVTWAGSPGSPTRSRRGVHRAATPLGSRSSAHKPVWRRKPKPCCNRHAPRRRRLRRFPPAPQRPSILSRPPSLRRWPPSSIRLVWSDGTSVNAFPNPTGASSTAGSRGICCSSAGLPIRCEKFSVSPARIFPAATATPTTTCTAPSRLPNARLCKAMVDRLTDQAHIIENQQKASLARF